jgi:hypothetical protein
MVAAAWNVLAVATMLGIFAACVGVVAVGVRMIEAALARRQRKHES